MPHVPTEQFVPTIAREQHADAGLLGQSAEPPMRIHRCVGQGFLVAVEHRRQVVQESLSVDLERMNAGPNGVEDGGNQSILGIAGLGGQDRAETGKFPVANETPGRAGNRRGVDAARHKNADRNVGNHVLGYGIRHRVPNDRRVLRPERTSAKGGGRPVPSWLRQRAIEINPRRMGGRYLADFLEAGLVRRVEVPKGEKPGQRIEVGRVRKLIEQQRTNFRSEEQRATDLSVVQRLHSEPVPRQELLPLAGIPNGEGKHAPQPLDRIASPAAVRSEEDCGVAAAHAGWRGPQFRRQVGEVVNFPIENDDVAGGRVMHRLGGRLR